MLARVSEKVATAAIVFMVFMISPAPFESNCFVSEHPVANLILRVILKKVADGEMEDFRELVHHEQL